MPSNVRITAEDAANDFSPNVGTVETFLAPGGPGIRFDTHLYTGYKVPPHYDSLLGKLIAWGSSRDEAIARMERALGEFVVTGIVHTAPFHRTLLADDTFRRGDVHTGLVSDILQRQAPAPPRE